MADDKQLRAQLQDAIARSAKLQSEVAALSRDKSNLIAESDSLYASKLKLEELCRALQIRNKEVTAAAAASVAESKAQRDETNERVAKTVADVQAKLKTYGDEQRAILNENGALRESVRAAADRHAMLTGEAEALRHQARVALQLADLRSQQVADLTALHAVESAEFREQLASARAGEGAVLQQTEVYRAKLGEMQAILTKELSVFQAFREDTGRQVERLSAAAKAADRAQSLAAVRALEAELALAQARAAEREREARHSAQVAALARLPKALAAERAAAREAAARAGALVRAALAQGHPKALPDGGAAAPGDGAPLCLCLDAGQAAELCALLETVGAGGPALRGAGGAGEGGGGGGAGASPGHLPAQPEPEGAAPSTTGQQEQQPEQQQEEEGAAAGEGGAAEPLAAVQRQQQQQPAEEEAEGAEQQQQQQQQQRLVDSAAAPLPHQHHQHHGDAACTDGGGEGGGGGVVAASVSLGQAAAATLGAAASDGVVSELAATLGVVAPES